MIARALAFVGVVLIGLTSRAVTSGAPNLGAEFPLATSNAERAQMAASGSLFLIVWTDSASGGLEVRGRLVRASDGQATGGSFVIASGMLDDPHPAVASDGTNFLVLWRDHVNAADVFDAQLFGARISLEGKILEPGVFVVCPPRADADTNTFSQTNPTLPAAVWSGTAWFAAWADSRYGDVRSLATRIAPDQKLLDADAFPVGGISSYPRPAADAAGDVFVVMFDMDGDELVGDLFRADGSFHASTVVAPGWYISDTSSIAGDGRDYLVTYECHGSCAPDSTMDEAPRSFAVEIDGATGQLRSATRRLISDHVSNHPIGDDAAHASVTFAGRWLIAREEPGSVRPNIWLDGTQLFAAAWAPQIAFTSGTGLAIATRGGDIVARTFHFDGGMPTPTPSGSPTPTASPSPDPSASPTAQASPTPTPPPNHKRSSGRCDIAFGQGNPAAAFGALTTLFAAAVALRRRRLDMPSSRIREIRGSACSFVGGSRLPELHRVAVRVQDPRERAVVLGGAARSHGESDREGPFAVPRLVWRARACRGSSASPARRRDRASRHRERPPGARLRGGRCAGGDVHGAAQREDGALEVAKDRGEDHGGVSVVERLAEAAGLPLQNSLMREACAA